MTGRDLDWKGRVEGIVEVLGMIVYDRSLCRGRVLENFLGI